MKKIVCVDPVINSRFISSFCLYDQDKFLYQHILDSRKEKENNCYFNSDDLKICFDVSKVYDYFNNNFSFIYDVKILYGLLGHKFDKLIDLMKQLPFDDDVEKYIEMSDKIKYHINSYKNTRIDISKFENEVLFPEGALEELYRQRSLLLVKSFNLIQDKDLINYYENYFYKFLPVIHSMNQNLVEINLDNFNNKDFTIPDFVKKNTKENKAKVQINPIGAKTGRMTCKKDSFNFYNINKSIRNIIQASNDSVFLQIDYKSFQPRLAIFSTNDEQFKNKFGNIDDIYSVFSGDRKRNKLAFLAWMYSNNSSERFSKEAYPIEKLKLETFKQARKENKIKNVFGRVLYFDDNTEEHVIFQNYITSLEVDFMISVCVELFNFLKEYKTKILFPFHDSIIFELNKNESHLVDSIGNIMINFFEKRTFFTKFPIDVKIGDNLGDMKNV